MGDSYREILVKKKQTTTEVMMKYGLIILSVLLLAAGLVLNSLLFLAGIILGAVAYFILIPKLDVEYEYLYVNGELDIDAIYSKQKRKRLGSYSIDEMEIMAKESSHALDSYRSKGKILDYTSSDPNAVCYLMVFNHENNTQLVKVELDSDIVNDIRRLAPRKVNLD